MGNDFSDFLGGAAGGFIQGHELRQQRTANRSKREIESAQLEEIRRGTQQRREQYGQEQELYNIMQMSPGEIANFYKGKENIPLYLNEFLHGAEANKQSLELAAARGEQEAAGARRAANTEDFGNRPIGAALAAQFNLDPRTTYREFEVVGSQAAQYARTQQGIDAARAASGAGDPWSNENSIASASAMHRIQQDAIGIGLGYVLQNFPEIQVEIQQAEQLGRSLDPMSILRRLPPAAQRQVMDYANQQAQFQMQQAQGMGLQGGGYPQQGQLQQQGGGGGPPGMGQQIPPQMFQQGPAPGPSPVDLMYGNTMGLSIPPQDFSSQEAPNDIFAANPGLYNLPAFQGPNAEQNYNLMNTHYKNNPNMNMGDALAGIQAQEQERIAAERAYTKRNRQSAKQRSVDSERNRKNPVRRSGRANR